MALNFFFQTITKNHAAVVYVCNPCELHFFTQHVYQFRRFHFLAVGLSPHLLVKSWLSAKPGQGF